MSLEDIYVIHEYVLQRYGGDPDHYRETEGKIKSIPAHQYPIFGVDRYPGVFHEAAMLWYFFAKDHCFVDGNKRVAMQSVIMFLEDNGYTDCLFDDDGTNKTFEIAASTIPDSERDQYINNLAKWLQSRFKRRPHLKGIPRRKL